MEALTVREISEAVHGKLLCGDPEAMITYISIDSRDVPAETLFVPIIGEKVDAHQFLGDVFEKGARAAFTSRGEIVDETKAHILVVDTQEAMGDLAIYYRKKFPVPVIGITGSVGKTSTKEMIAAALSVKYNVLKTAGNQNSNIGVPLTLYRLGPQHEIAVVEMGISDFGEMDALVSFAEPETAVVTNIGVAHIAILKTRENICSEKLKIGKNFGPDQKLYLNGDDPMLLNAAQKLKTAQLYGIGPDCPYRAENIRIQDGLQQFDYIYPQGSEAIALKQLGLHNVSNAIVALTIASQYGIAPADAKPGLFAYEGVAMRQQINHLRDGIKVIDDTYNASPDSIKSGVQVLLALDNPGRKIAQLGDVLELGELSWQCHYDTGVYIANTAVDEVCVVGEEMKALIQAIQEYNPKMVVHHFGVNEEAANYLSGIVKPGDAVLVKGSRGMHQEEIVQILKESFGFPV